MLPFFLLFIHCDEHSEKSYYPDGSLKSEFFLNNGKYKGIFKQYYQSGALQELHNYSNGVKVDSSLYFKKNSSLDYIDYYNYEDSISIYRKYFYGNGFLKSEGSLHNKGFMIGYWLFYNEKEGYLEEIREIKNINNQPHLNQSWLLNAKGDTIHDKSVYASFLFFKDTISVGDPVKVYAVQEQPFFKNKSSSVMVIIPKDYSEDFNESFTNFREINIDTTYNLNIEKEYRMAGNMPEGDYALEIIFGRYYHTKGNKKFRGILIEYYTPDSNGIDSLEYLEHKIYFEKSIYVRDTVDLVLN